MRTQHTPLRFHFDCLPAHRRGWPKFKNHQLRQNGAKSYCWVKNYFSLAGFTRIYPDLVGLGLTGLDRILGSDMAGLGFVLASIWLRFDQL
jgi:hypothetical protein